MFGREKTPIGLVFFTKFLAVVLALLLVARFIPGIEVENISTALIVAVILGIFNITLRPVLLLLTLPITLITLGLFSFVINAFLFWTVSAFIEGFIVTGFVSAFVGALILSLASSIADKVIV